MTAVDDLVQQYVERVWNDADLDEFSALTSPDFLYYFAGQPPRDPAAFADFVLQTHAAFPDWNVQVASLIVSREKAAVRWSGQVTHLGPFRGIPATGRTVKVTGINVYEVKDGKIVAEWEQMDSLGMLLQLGALPA